MKYSGRQSRLNAGPSGRTELRVRPFFYAGLTAFYDEGGIWTWLTDIEIAQSTQMKPIQEIAETAGVPEEYLECYGRYKAKVDYKLLNEVQAEDGKLIL